VYKLDQSGNVSALHTFSFADGALPIAGLTQGTDGNLYGTTSGGGSGNNPAGTLFQITTSGKFKSLYTFGTAGKTPYGGVSQDTNGKFFGTTNGGGLYGYGTVYSLDMTLGPFITFVRPTGKAGQTVQILGQGLTGTSSVTFNGVKATSFKVVSDTYMTAVRIMYFTQRREYNPDEPPAKVSRQKFTNSLQNSYPLAGGGKVD
jgi:uncharacterized repeat protein (TIGR03803 family)